MSTLIAAEIKDYGPVTGSEGFKHNITSRFNVLVNQKHLPVKLEEY
ncbi:MAG: hypothetical protein ABIO41_12065 [Ignavibacteria bacterium]